MSASLPRALPLRPYQQECVDAVETAWAGGIQRPAAVLATGLGKTVIFSHIAQRWINGLDWLSWSTQRKRVLILAHRDELVRQAAIKVKGIAPDLQVGIVKAGENEVEADIVVASVQTLSSPYRLEQLDMDSDWLVICDEAHHAAARSYRYIFDTIPASAYVGFTATMSRGDSLALGDVWQEVVYERDILYGIRTGHLSDVRGIRVTVDGLDLTGVTRRGGDYADGELGDAMIEADAPKVAAQAYLEHAGDRQGVIFAPTIASAEAFADEFSASGLPAGLITGSTPLDERADLFERFRSGKLRALASCMVLTEGWDEPIASCAVIARPTTIPGLYIQMAGRVLRPYPGKRDALILDVCGVTGRHTLMSVTNLAGSSADQVDVRDGESLAEAVERIEEETHRKVAVMGRLEAQEVDLFAASESKWLRTQAGTWFIPTKEALIFLAQRTPGESSLYHVGICPPKTLRGGRWLHEDIPLDLAMAWGEQEARRIDPVGTYSAKGAAWRKGNISPSTKQLDLAASLRIPGYDTMTKKELSDAISVVFASRVLDGKVGR